VILADEDYDLSDDLLLKIKISGKRAVQAADEVWHKDKQELLNDLRDDLKVIKSKRAEKEAIVKLLSVKISENEAIQKLSDEVKKEEEKLIKFIDVETQTKRIEEKYNELLQQLTAKFLKYHEIHQIYADAIN